MLTRQHKITMGVCMSRTLKEQIDFIRGDVSRSKFISKILEKELANRDDIDDQQSQPELRLRRDFADISHREL
jgi:metal-responsive CopG/Arc/MetJ family transcriptional regulator